MIDFISETTERVIYSQPAGQRFTASDVDADATIGRTWLFLAKAFCKRQRRDSDHAMLMMSRDQQSFVWTRQDPS